MTETKIRKRLADFCKSGDIKKVKAIYTILHDEIEEATAWDEEFIKEIERREKSFLDGTAETYTLEEAKQMARERIKAKKNNGLSLQNT